MNSIEQFEMLCASIVSLFMIIFNFRTLYIKKNCLKEVQAICVRANVHKRRYNVKMYFPIMRYEVNNVIYENSPIGAMGNGSQWFWRINKKYTIYVNEKNPRYFVLDQKIILDDIFLALLGFVIFMGILVVFVGTQVL